MNMQYNTPRPGDIVTVTTRYPNHYLDKKGEWFETTYRNVLVVEPHRWVKANEFCIPAEGEPYLKKRVINLSNVSYLEIAGRSATTAAPSSVKFVEVAGSKGDVYEVTIKNGVPKFCTCKGFMFRKNCRHLKEAVK